MRNYSRALIAHLAQHFPNNEYLIFTPKVKQTLVNLTLFQLPNVSLKLPQSKQRFLWRSFNIRKDLVDNKIELFHGLSHEIPFGLKQTGIKSIVTIHDLIFLRFPHYYKFIDRLIYQFKSKFACKNADQIIAISQKTKDDIVAYYHIDPAKIEVIYQSCDDSFKKPISSDIKDKISAKYHLPTNFILSVGTIESRKNLLLLIKALPKIDPTYQLIVIGKETPYATIVKNEIAKLGLQNRVIFLKNVSFDELPAIYQMAKLFVYPSLYEGFGIPIIEALYSGTPVIATKGSCLEEAGGPNSKYIEVNDTAGLAKFANEIISNEALRNDMIKNGLNFIQRFNNDVISKQLMNCYLKTIGK